MRLRDRAETETATLSRVRPSFYALPSGGWSDYVTLLHPPYTLWHLSFVIFGAAISTSLHYDRLAATLVAFFLAVGVSAHALDELRGRPLATAIPARVLWALAVGGLVGAVALGVVGAAVVSPWLLGFVGFGLFIAPAYNLEWFGGRFHTDCWFAASWGAFPLLTASFAMSGTVELAAIVGAAMAFVLSLAQRTLSTRVRSLRRKARGIEGRVLYADGTVEDVDRAWATAPAERALMLLSLGLFLASVSLLVARG
jgi:hypothetical protein